MTDTRIAAPRPAVPIPPLAGHARRRTAWLVPAVAVTTGVAFIGLHAIQYGHWIDDDAGITFAYARNISDGAGSVLQPDAEPTEGYSDPAWLALMVVGRLLGLFDHGAIFGIPDYVLFPKALSLLCCAGVLAGCHTAASKVFRRPWVVTGLAGLILAANPSFVIWSFSGLENPLYALVTTWLGVVLFTASVDDRLSSTRVALAAGLLAAVAALTRPDGLVFCGAYPIVVLITVGRHRWRPGLRSVALSLAAFAVPYGGYLTWRLAAFGRWTALPAVAKGQAAPRVDQFNRVGDLVQYVGPLVVLILALCVGMTLARPSRLRRGLIALLVSLSLSLIAYVTLKQDWMGNYRFATPVWCLASLIVALAVPRVVQRTGVRGRVVLLVILAGALWPTGTVFVSAEQGFRGDPTVPMCAVAEQFGRTFNGYLDILGAHQASLLTPDIGGTALTSGLTVVDLAGLAESRMADYWGHHDMTGLRNYVFDEVRPTFMHLHEGWLNLTGLLSDARLLRDYYPIFQWPENPTDSDWVRQDAVPDPDRLSALRAYAWTTKPRVENEGRRAPRSHCGPTLRPGQLPARA